MSAPTLSIHSSTPLRVALAAPPLVRAGVMSLLQGHSERVQVLSLESAEQPDVGLIDLLSMSRRPPPWADLPVVALVPDNPQARAVADLMGVTRALSADAPSEQMAQALQAAHDEWTGGDLDIRTDTHPEVLLSPREAEILTLISRGLSNEQVTAELYLSLNTVKSHIRSAYRKIGVTTRAQAVIWCFTYGRGRSKVPQDHR